MATKLIRKLGFLGMIFFYLVAGINHFIMPEFYYPLIPDYLPAKVLINGVSGSLEILLAIGMLIPWTRKWSALGIILLLLVFIPSHIYFIQIGSCVDSSLCVAEWIAWIRLVVVHPVLMFWAWCYRDFNWTQVSDNESGH